MSGNDRFHSVEETKAKAPALARPRFSDSEGSKTLSQLWLFALPFPAWRGDSHVLTVGSRASRMDRGERPVRRGTRGWTGPKNHCWSSAPSSWMTDGVRGAWMLVSLELKEAYVVRWRRGRVPVVLPWVLGRCFENWRGLLEQTWCLGR